MAMQISESFGAWLRRQDGRNDPVGDLANDFIASGSKATTERGVRQNLTKHRASEPAWAALEMAVSQWGQA